MLHMYTLEPIRSFDKCSHVLTKITILTQNTTKTIYTVELLIYSCLQNDQNTLKSKMTKIPF